MLRDGGFLRSLPGKAVKAVKKKLKGKEEDPKMQQKAKAKAHGALHQYRIRLLISLSDVWVFIQEGHGIGEFSKGPIWAWQEVIPSLQANVCRVRTWEDWATQDVLRFTEWETHQNKINKGELLMPWGSAFDCLVRMALSWSRQLLHIASKGGEQTWQFCMSENQWCCRNFWKGYKFYSWWKKCYTSSGTGTPIPHSKWDDLERGAGFWPSTTAHDWECLDGRWVWVVTSGERVWSTASTAPATLYRLWSFIAPNLQLPTHS